MRCGVICSLLSDIINHTSHILHSVPCFPVVSTSTRPRTAPGIWPSTNRCSQRAADYGEAALRFYQWREPTLSLGYFQAYAERKAHAASRQAAVVRRSSGGGALVHDCELTYALCLPTEHALAPQSATLYAAVHGALIDALASLDVRARLQGDTAPPEGIPATHFLCFARRTSQDVVLSIPRRRRGCRWSGQNRRQRSAPLARRRPAARRRAVGPIGMCPGVARNPRTDGPGAPAGAAGSALERSARREAEPGPFGRGFDG